MTVKLNDVEIMTEDGQLTEGFNPGMIDEKYKDSKYFETRKDIKSIMKSALETKSAYDKKLENVIQKPAADATPEQKAEYRKALAREMGAPEKSDAYEFEAPPEGLQHNEELVKVFKDVFLKEGVPVSTASALVKAFDAFNVKMIQAQQEEADRQFAAEVESYDKAHPEDAKVTQGRTAVKAILQFGDSDLTKAIRDAKLIDRPDDHSLWKSLGFSPRQRVIWENIGKLMKSDAAIPNEGNQSGTPKEGTQEATIAKMYDHPTSKANRAARGLKY